MDFSSGSSFDQRFDLLPNEDSGTFLENDSVGLGGSTDWMSLSEVLFPGDMQDFSSTTSFSGGLDLFDSSLNNPLDFLPPYSPSSSFSCPTPPSAMETKPVIKQQPPSPARPALVKVPSPAVQVPSVSTMSNPSVSNMSNRTARLVAGSTPSARTTFANPPRGDQSRGCPKRRRKTIQLKRQEQLSRLETLSVVQHELRDIVRVASEEVSNARRTLYNVLKSHRDGLLVLSAAERAEHSASGVGPAPAVRSSRTLEETH